MAGAGKTGRRKGNRRPRTRVPRAPGGSTGMLNRRSTLTSTLQTLVNTTVVLLTIDTADFPALDPLIRLYLEFRARAMSCRFLPTLGAFSPGIITFTVGGADTVAPSSGNGLVLSGSVTKPVSTSPSISWRAGPTETWGNITGAAPPLPATLGPRSAPWIAYSASVPPTAASAASVTGIFEVVIEYCTRGYA